LFSSPTIAVTSSAANLTTFIVVCMSGLGCAVVDLSVTLIVVDTVGSFTVVVYLTVVAVVVVRGVVVVVVVVRIVVEAVVVKVTAGVVKVGGGVVNSSNASIFLLISSSCGISEVFNSGFNSSGSLRKHFSILSWV